MRIIITIFALLFSFAAMADTCNVSLANASCTPQQQCKALVLINSSGLQYKHYRIETRNALSSSGADSEYTMLVSSDGAQSWHVDTEYSDTGLQAWSSGNPIYSGLGPHMNQSAGYHWAVDIAGSPVFGATGHIDIYTPGISAGHSVETQFISRITMSTASNAIVSDYYSGFYKGAVGQQMNAFRLQTDRWWPHGQPTPTISGEVRLYGCIE